MVNDEQTKAKLRTPNASTSIENSINSKDLDASVERDVRDAVKSDNKSHKSTFLNKVWAEVYHLLYPEIILAHLDWKSLKTVLRSWLMMWSLTLLSISTKTDHFMGPSAYLSYFSAGIEIAGDLSVSAAFCYCMSDLISLCFAFLVSVVVMAINWSIHGWQDETQLIAQLVSDGVCSIDSTFDSCLLPHAHRGYFLDIKSTVVTIFGMMFSFTACGYYQSYSKYGKLAWLLNSLFTIIVFSFNNMMPLWAPWLYARNCFVPMSMAFAARFTVSLLIFPFSSNYKIVRSLSTACVELAEVCERMESLSSTLLPSSENFDKTFEFVSADTQSVFTKYIVSDMDLQMVAYLELWISRFEEPDLVEMRFQVRLVMSSLSSFHFFFQTMIDRMLDIKSGTHVDAFERLRMDSEKVAVPKVAPKLIKNNLMHTWNDTGSFEKRQRSKYSEDKTHNIKFTSFDTSPNDPTTLDDIDNEFTKIVKAYSPLVASTSGLLKLLGKWLELACNVFSQSKELTNIVQQITEELPKHAELILTTKQTVVPEDRAMAMYGFICQNFSVRVKSLALCCIKLHHERPHPILIWPFKSRVSPHATSIETDNLDYDGYHNIIGSSLSRTYTSFKPVNQVQARNPDSSLPRNMSHLLGLGVERVVKLVYDADLLFSIKRGMLVTAALTPYFTRPMCLLAYENWLLWVAVLTSYTVGRQAVDGIYGFVAKLVYTFWACVVGLIGWYICAGKGRGNPYGFAAVTACIWMYICFQRQFNKHFAPATSIVYSCTLSGVLGLSWASGHYGLKGIDLGRGFKVAWVRFVTVVIGITISFIGTVLPYPYTAKQAVRTIVGNCLEHLGDLQSSISNFGYQRFQISSTHIIASKDVVTKSSRGIITNLESAETLRQRLIYEPPLSGKYPTNRYKLLIRYVNEVTLLYSLIYSFLDQIEDNSKIPELLTIMGWTDPKLCTGTYSIVYMCGRALTDASPLPSVTPANLIEFYVFDLLRKRFPRQRPNSESTSLVVTAVALSCQIYERLDGILMLIKELVGEVYDLNMDIFDIDLEKQQRSQLLKYSAEL